MCGGCLEVSRFILAADSEAQAQAWWRLLRSTFTHTPTQENSHHPPTHKVIATRRHHGSFVSGAWLVRALAWSSKGAGRFRYVPPPQDLLCPPTFLFHHGGLQTKQTLPNTSQERHHLLGLCMSFVLVATRLTSCRCAFIPSSSFMKKPMSSLAATASSAPPSTPPPPTTTPSPLDPHARYASHDDFVCALQGLEGDPLHDTGTNVVIYRGNPNAKIMVVGEAPGETEDIEGKPFVGRAGKLLDDILTRYGSFKLRLSAHPSTHLLAHLSIHPPTQVSA